MATMHERIVTAVRKDGLGKKLKDVLIACYDQIVAGEIVSVAELMEYLEDLGWDPRLEQVIRRCYRLIRETHWGIFKHLDPDTHPKLWKALTITNRTMPDVADLKRNVVVPNVFCALLDIHAYTDFCRRNRHNVSMLRALDDMINQDMREIAARNACLSARAAGDTIIVLGSSPSDVIHACLGIIDSFSRRRVIQAAALAEARKGSSTVVQDFHVSAGIAGGLHYSSLIVTQDGDISGSVVNTAARLQGFAGTIAPDRSKVMITSHVYAGYVKEVESDRQKSSELVFFDCGKIGFKGTSVGVYELLYAEREVKRVRYQQEYTDVFETKKKGSWTDRLVPDATRLIAKVLATIPISGVEIVHEGMATTFTNAQVIRLCEQAIELYESEKDHREVSSRLQQIVEAIQYERIIENQIGLFNAKERSVIDHAARLERMRDALIERGLQVEVYSGKR